MRTSIYEERLKEVLPIVQEIREKNQIEEQVERLYKWCCSQGELQPKVIGNYVMGALESLVEDKAERDRVEKEGAQKEEASGRFVGDSKKESEQVPQLVAQFAEISWLMRLDLMPVRLQQVIERLAS